MAMSYDYKIRVDIRLFSRLPVIVAKDLSQVAFYAEIYNRVVSFFYVLTSSEGWDFEFL